MTQRQEVRDLSNVEETHTDKQTVTNTDDFLMRMMKGCVQLFNRPSIMNTINMVPVDHVARVVVAAAFSPPTSTLSVCQVTSHPRLTFNEFLRTLQLYGWDVSEVNYDRWRESLDVFVERGTEPHALYVNIQYMGQQWCMEVLTILVGCRCTIS